MHSEDFPRRLTMRGVAFELAYRFDPGAADDGATLTVPLYALNQVDAARCEWLVPGMLADKVNALLKSLPQKLRRHLVPVADSAQAFCDRWGQADGPRALGSRPLIQALIDDVHETHRLRIAPTDFKLETVPPHLFLNFRLVDNHGAVLGLSRNLAELRARHGDRAQGSFQDALRDIAGRMGGAALAVDGLATEGEGRRRSAPVQVRSSPRNTVPADPADGIDPGRATASPTAAGAASAQLVLQAGQRHRDWCFGPLPELMELGQGRERLIGYPGLVDAGDAVELQVFDSPEEARSVHRRGLSRLFAIVLREPLRFFERNLPDVVKLGVLYAPFGGVEDLRRELVAVVIDRACLGDPWPADAAAFQARIAQARPRLNLVGQEVARSLMAVLLEHQAMSRKLPAARGHPAAADIAAQLAALMPKGWLRDTLPAQWAHLPRYLKAIGLRLDKLRADPARDAALLAQIEALQAPYRRALAQRRGEADPRLAEFRWLLEELRVSLFAQELRTPMPVSVKRLQKAWAAILAAG